MPTVAERGFPGFEADQWYGVVAPADTPAERIERLNAEINKALALPDVSSTSQFAVEGAGRYAVDAEGLRRPHRARDPALGRGGEGGEREAGLSAPELRDFLGRVD